MQTGIEQLKRQQEIMKSLTFYSGKIDGIWGPDAIAAKQKWEFSGKFAPGIPNNGFPLSSKGPFPRGIRYDKLSGLLLGAGIETSVIAVEKPAPLKDSTELKEGSKQEIETKTVNEDRKKV